MRVYITAFNYVKNIFGDSQYMETSKIATDETHFLEYETPCGGLDSGICNITQSYGINTMPAESFSIPAMKKKIIAIYRSDVELENTERLPDLLGA